jgi:hypothetical protein
VRHPFPPPFSSHPRRGFVAERRFITRPLPICNPPSLSRASSPSSPYAERAVERLQLVDRHVPRTPARGASARCLGHVGRAAGAAAFSRFLTPVCHRVGANHLSHMPHLCAHVLM